MNKISVCFLTSSNIFSISIFGFCLWHVICLLYCMWTTQSQILSITIYLAPIFLDYLSTHFPATWMDLEKSMLSEKCFYLTFYLDVKVDSNHEIVIFIEKYLNLRAMLLYIIFPDVLRFMMEFFFPKNIYKVSKIHNPVNIFLYIYSYHYLSIITRQ